MEKQTISPGMVIEGGREEVPEGHVGVTKRRRLRFFFVVAVVDETRRLVGVTENRIVTIDNCPDLKVILP